MSHIKERNYAANAASIERVPSRLTGYMYGGIGGSIVTFFAIMIGCAATSKSPLPNPNDSIKTVTTTNKSLSEVLPVRADHIDSATKQIEANVPQQVQVRIGPPVAAIKAETSGLRDDAQKLVGTLQGLATATTQVSALRSSNEQLGAANGKLTTQVQKDEQTIKDDNSNRVKAAIGWTIVLSILGIGAGVVLFIHGNAYGVLCSIGSATCLVVSIFVLTYMTYLLIAGGILAALAIGFIAYELYVHRKAAVQLVQTGEVDKQVMTPEQRSMVYGVGVTTGVAGTIQSPSTVKIVDRIRGVSDSKVYLAPPLNATVKPAGLTSAASVAA